MLGGLPRARVCPCEDGAPDDAPHHMLASPRAPARTGRTKPHSKPTARHGFGVARDTSGPLFAWVKLIVEPPLAFGFSPQWTPQNRPYVDSSKPANGQRPRQALLVSCRAVERQAFSPQGGGHCFLSSAAVMVLVRQLRGPHFSTCPWWSSRSSIALTAAVSPSSLPQSSTGRFEVSSVLARS